MCAPRPLCLRPKPRTARRSGEARLPRRSAREVTPGFVPKDPVKLRGFLGYRSGLQGTRLATGRGLPPRACRRDASSTSGSPPPGPSRLWSGRPNAYFDQFVQKTTASDHPTRRHGTRTALAAERSGIILLPLTLPLMGGRPSGFVGN
jgi:hypothetical protein